MIVSRPREFLWLPWYVSAGPTQWLFQFHGSKETKDISTNNAGIDKSTVEWD